jgi:hypothetical protein
MVSLLMVLLCLSKRRVSSCCEKLFGVSMSPRLVMQLQNIVTASILAAYVNRA